MELSYWGILVWMLFFGGLSVKMEGMKRTVRVADRYALRYHPVWALAAVLPLIWMTTVRGEVGDTGSYVMMFEDMPNTLHDIGIYMSSVSKDWGFYFCSALIHSLITQNVKIYFCILAILQGGILALVYRKYSTRYVLSMFLFLASTDYISWMFNGIRQFTAVAITFACMGLLLRRRYIVVILLVLLAAAFHGSALLVLPFLFLAQGKAWNRKTIFFMAVVMLLVVFAGQFTGILDVFLQDTSYKNVVSDWKMLEDDGTNPLRVAVYAMPAVLSVIGIRQIREADDPVINLCTNMSVAATGFYLISMFTSGIFIGRLPVYFSLYSYILLPWEIEHIFSEKSAKLLYVCLIVGYLGFYAYSIRMLTAGN